MNTTTYFLIQLGFGTLTLVCLSLVLRGLWLVLQQDSYRQSRKKRIFFVTLTGMVVWLTFISLLSIKGFFQDFSTFPPRITVAVFPPLVTILIITFSKGFRRLLGFVPASWFIYLQSFRVVVEILLWALFGQGLLPVQMTFEGRNVDILVGLTAPIIGYCCFTKAKWPKRVALWWNIAGLVVVTNIVVTAILSMPTPFRIFMNEPSSTIIAHFPMMWLPGVLVPLAYALHFFSLRQLSLQQNHFQTESRQLAL